MSAAAKPAAIHLPSLAAAILIMLAGTVYPLMMANAAGKADHNLATALFVAMSAGLVRGVGFVPRRLVWRVLFSGWTCLAALCLAIWIKFF